MKDISEGLFEVKSLTGRIVEEEGIAKLVTEQGDYSLPKSCLESLREGEERVIVPLTTGAGGSYLTFTKLDNDEYKVEEYVVPQMPF